MSAFELSRLEMVVGGLDTWLDSMRVDWPVHGYGGPVCHWWNQSTVFGGAGLDWRYEGIVAGYLALWARNADQRWLDKAIRAGDDLVDGQLASGSFVNSQFELNPGTGGTPHEAACSLALLELTQTLQSIGRIDLGKYASCAERNLLEVHIRHLWDAKRRTLNDRPGIDSFVPNKAATFGEAMLLLAEVSSDQSWIESVALPIGERIVDLQNREPGSTNQGGIAQVVLNGTIVHAYFPLYVARCIPFLLAIGKRTGDQRFNHAAIDASRFLQRHVQADGGSPQVIYGDGRSNVYPRWIAGAGDIARALALASDPQAPEVTSITSWICSGVNGDGSIATAAGFERAGSILGKRDRAFDRMAVVGWCDKAFRFFAEQLRSASCVVRPTHDRELIGLSHGF